jgi:hypothetical protein
MGAAFGVSEPILFSVTAPRLWPLLVLLACLVAGFWAARLLRGPRLFPEGGWHATRWALSLGLLAVGACGLWAAVQLASPAVRLKATERGLTSYMTGASADGGARLQMARHADGDGLFIPWRAMASLGLERVECVTAGQAVPCDVLAIRLRPGFEELRVHGIVVAPGVRRATLDVPVPSPPGGPAVLAALSALHQRFEGR